MAEKKETYPVLPLRDIVVYPKMVVPLFVGREKSIRALQAGVDSDKNIILATQKDPGIEDPTEDDIYHVGTIGTVLQLLRLPDGVLVVRAGQSLVRRDQQARRHAGQGLGIGIHRIHIPALYGAVRVEHAADLRLQCLEIRPCVVQILFGLPQLRLGDQIHGVGDLLGLPYASDAPADLTGAGHALTARPCA